MGHMAIAWGINDKAKTVVHDGAANMKETASVNNWIDVGCSAHKLHLSITVMYMSAISIHIGYRSASTDKCRPIMSSSDLKTVSSSNFSRFVTQLTL